METFVLDARQWRIARIVSSNPLVRLGDRVEALAVMFAVVVSLIAVPVAAVVATTVYQSHRDGYVTQARTRHPVAVAATATAGPTDAGRVTGFAAESGGRASFVLDGAPAKIAEPDRMWVDDNGDRVSAPTPPSRAQFDALGVAVSIVAGVIVAMTSLVAATRWRLDRVRMSGWDRELEGLLDEGGRADDSGYGRMP